jgi:hypothetical protein
MDKGLLIFVWRHAKEIAAIVLLAGMVISGSTYFATAADVEQKFSSLKVDIKKSALEGRKLNIEDALFRLRSSPKQQGTTAQIERFEAELRDVSARLRQLDERKP